MSSNRRVFLSCDKALGSKELFQLVAKKHGFEYTDKADDESCDLHWTDFRSTLNPAFYATVAKCPRAVTNHFPELDQCVDKVAAARRLNAFRALFAKDFDFYPRSWDLLPQLREFERAFDKSGARTYILKPNVGARGTGIRLAQK